jgi:histone H3/H4
VSKSKDKTAQKGTTKVVPEPKPKFAPLVVDNDPKRQAEMREKLITRLGDDYKIDNLDRAILSLMAQYPSITQEEIAKACGMNRSAIAKRVNKPAFKTAMNEFNKGILQVLIEAQSDAIKQMRKLVNATDIDNDTRIAAARVILSPLNRMEQNTPPPMNIIYTVQFGEGGQLVRTAKPLDPSRVLEVSAG